MALFDGGLVVSLATNWREQYVRSVLDLLEASEETETPVFG